MWVQSWVSLAMLSRLGEPGVCARPRISACVTRDCLSITERGCNAITTLVQRQRARGGVSATLAAGLAFYKLQRRVFCTDFSTSGRRKTCRLV